MATEAAEIPFYLAAVHHVRALDLERYVTVTSWRARVSAGPHRACALALAANCNSGARPVPVEAPSWTLSCFAPLGPREPDFRSDCGRLSRAASTRRHHRAEEMGCASSKDAMSDSMGRAMYEAAKEGNEVELRRLIGLGWSVNWHNPEVRRFAWALASSPPLLLRSPSPPTRRRPTRRQQISPQLAARSAAALAVPPPRRPAELCTRVLVARRARRTPASSSTLLASWHFMSPVYAQFGWTALMTATTHGREGCVRLLLESEAIEVNATEVSLERALP